MIKIIKFMSPSNYEPLHYTNIWYMSKPK